MKRTYTDVAKEIVHAYFDNLANKDKLSIDGFMEILAIQDDENVLLEHIKAMRDIFNKAIEEMEGNNGTE